MCAEPGNSGDFDAAADAPGFAVFSETFVDHATRQAFDTYQEYVDLYGADRPIREVDYIRIAAQRMVPSDIRARLEMARTA